MGFFKDFIEGDAFFPVLIGLMLALVLVFVWILLSGKKKINNQKNDNEIENIVEHQQMPVTTESVIEESIEIPKMSEEVIEKTSSNVLVSLPINNMDETPVEVNISNNIIDDTGEMVEIEKTQPLVEENISEDQYVNIEIPTMQIEEKGETVALPEAKTLVEDSSGEQVELPAPKAMIKEEGEEAVAFDSLPEANRIINTDVKIAEKEEYVGEQTEIFDFPDFNNIENKSDEAMTGNVEDDVIKAANNYISTVFKEN